MNALTVLLLLLAVPFSMLYLALNVVVVKLLFAGVKFFRYGKRAADAGRAHLSSEAGQPSFDPVVAKSGDARSHPG